MSVNTEAASNGSEQNKQQIIEMLQSYRQADALRQSLADAHPNPVNIWNTSDEERAELLAQYLDVIKQVCPNPQLIPLDESGKESAITGTRGLGSYRERWMQTSGDEAIEAIEQGTNGFVLYAGRSAHGTENLVFADHDDCQTFPIDTLPETLTAISGSGEGYHETFVNAGNVQNAHGSGAMDGAGEIRASNWYVVLPGSIHPSGGIYHLEKERPVAGLEADDIPDGLRPATDSHNGEEIELSQESLDGNFTNELGMSLDEVREYDDDLDKLLDTSPRTNSETQDDSRVDARLVWRLRFHHFDRSDIVAIWERYRNRPKLERDDYVKRTIQFAGTHGERCQYGRSEQSVTLPEPPTSEWDWREASLGDERALTLNEARKRCQEHIDDALCDGEHTLIDALPAMGKSSGVVRGAARTDTRITVFTARHELYEQYSEWCEEHGLSHYRLPSFHEDCPTADGEHGSEWKDRVLSLYKDNVMPSEIHKHAEQHFGESLPCDDGQECPYKQQWDAEFDEYDVLIGHYTHSYQQNTTVGRVAVFDEFPADSFLIKFDSDTVSSAVSAYLSNQDQLPFENYTDLLEQRSSEQGDKARDWFKSVELEREVNRVLFDESESAHAYAPLLTYAVLCGEDLGNGWEHTDLDPNAGVDTHRRAARNRDSSEVHLLLPPELDEANGVLSLDGTPTLNLWKLTLDTRLSREQVLSNEERAEYLSGALELSIIQTAGDAAYSYSGGNAVKSERDELLFKAVAEREGTEPALISTKKANNQYEQERVLTSIGKHEHYGNLKSSNQFKDERVGIVAGSTHYGDNHPKMWGALAGTSVERVGDGRGMNLDYGEFGNKVLRHMREYEVLQAVLRFGRNDMPTTVYVHTAALPEWVPVEARGEIQQWSKGTRKVVEVLEADAPDKWKTSEISERVSISERQVRNVMNQLAEDNLVEKGKDGRATLWVVEDDEIDRLQRVQFRSS